MPTVAALLRDAGRQLASVSDTEALDARLLLAHVLEKNLTWLQTWPENEVPADQQTAFNALLARRAQGEPVAYLLGTQPFWTLELDVSPHTLIPRPETELLVEKVLELLPANEHCRLIDLGTGTGAIALALASERPHWEITACDFSEGALEVARRNQQRLNLDVQILQSDWLSAIPAQSFHAVLSNPPYIEEQDAHLAQGDVRFEPRSALVSGADGLQDIRRIADQARGYLLPGGLLMLEHGYQQGQAVRDLLQVFGYVKVETCRDLAGHERITFGFRPEDATYAE